MSDSIPKKHIKSSVEAIKKKPWCKELKLVIGGVGNYRYDVWIQKKYKGNRENISRPNMLSSLNDWVIKEYNPIVSNNCEADDILSIQGWSGYSKAVKYQKKDASDIVLCHIDKDIFQIPGYHYLYSAYNAYPVWTSPLEAAKNFNIQMLCGDKTDNIIGLPKIRSQSSGKFVNCGKITANKLLYSCKSEEEMLLKVEEAYKDYYTIRVSNKLCMWEVAIQENFQLLRLQNKEGVIPDYFKYKEEVVS